MFCFQLERGASSTFPLQWRSVFCLDTDITACWRFPFPVSCSSCYYWWSQETTQLLFLSSLMVLSTTSSRTGASLATSENLGQQQLRNSTFFLLILSVYLDRIPTLRLWWNLISTLLKTDGPLCCSTWACLWGGWPLVPRMVRVIWPWVPATLFLTGVLKSQLVKHWRTVVASW